MGDLYNKTNEKRALGLPIDFTRTNNSINTTYKLLGRIWDFRHYSTIMTLTSPSNVILVQLPNGTNDYFTMSGTSYT